MQAILAEPMSAAYPSNEMEADLRRAWWLANLMDAQFELAGIKFGLDAIVGLVPIAGDTISGVAALYPIYLAKKHGIGRMVTGRMIVNVGVDWLAGAVPLLGDLLDVGFKANLANVKLLEDSLRRRGAVRD